jgi:hypothetical protein
MQTKNSKLFYFLLVLCPALLVIILFQNCSADKTVLPVNDEPGNATARLANPPSRFCIDSACLGYNGEQLPGRINFSTAMRMANDYALDKGKYYIWNQDVNTEVPDARNIWFDLARMKQIIGYIESKLCQAQCNENTHLGIRFYFAKYPDKNTIQSLPDLTGVPLDYERHHTLFMVPTYWDPVKKANIDFDPGGITKGCILAPIDPIKGHALIATGPSEAGTDGENHGGLRPPPENTGSFPTTY